MTRREAREIYQSWYAEQLEKRRILAAELIALLPSLDPQDVGRSIPRDVLEICWRYVRALAGRPAKPVEWAPCPLAGALLPGLPWQADRPGRGRSA